MGARGRPSRAELAVVPFKAAEARRPDPPAELTKAQAEVWTSIVASLPADWVSVANAPLMAAFCRHVTAARRIARRIEAEEQSDAFNLASYGQLLSMQERESRAMATLATKLRLARSSVDDRRKAPKPTSGPRPWEV
jgi:hypothetical protein